MTSSLLNPEVQTAQTAAGTAFARLPTHAGKPAATLLLLASTGRETLATEPYCLVGRSLYSHGWNVVSLDLPCHGADHRAGEPTELEGWAARAAGGEDFVANFQERVNDVIEHLIKTGVADPARIAAAGTSRGGFMAFQTAAGNPRIRAVVGFAPVTDLLALHEFTGQEPNPLTRRLALVNATKPLADRAAWITIGHADARVDTRKAEAFARALIAERRLSGSAQDITICVAPVPGHASLPEWHDAAASWLKQRISTL